MFLVQSEGIDYVIGQSGRAVTFAGSVGYEDRSCSTCETDEVDKVEANGAFWGWIENFY